METVNILFFVDRQTGDAANISVPIRLFEMFLTL